MPDDDDCVQKNEWRIVVKNAKKSSTSSVFSRRDCAVHECALECEILVEVFVQFHNVIIKHDHCPRCWLKVVDVVLEKVKGLEQTN